MDALGKQMVFMRQKEERRGEKLAYRICNELGAMCTCNLVAGLQVVEKCVI